MLLVELLIALVMLAASALLSAAETAVMLLPAGRVHRLAESERTGARALSSLTERRHRLRAVSGLVAGSAFLASGATTASAIVFYAAPSGGSSGDAAWVYIGPVLALIGGLLGVAICYSLAQAMPRALAVANPERIGLETSRVALPVVEAVWPIARALTAPWRWGLELASKEPLMTPWAISPEFRGAGAGEETERDEAEEALFDAVTEFAEKVAREVMVPRTDVAALPDTASVSEAIAMIHKRGFSRLPVYHESIDDVRGVLFAKDLLVALGRGQSNPDIGRIARPAFFVPETKPVEELLFEMRTRTHIAIVADEYGGTSGIVTLEDLLEEIVGEISDEYDRDEPLLVDLGHGCYRVDARLPVDDLNELLGTDLDTEADSVGGLFTDVAGRIPETGESVDIEGLRFTVTAREGTRVRELSVEPVESGRKE